MKALRRFFRRLGSWTRTRQDEERLRAEIEEHLAMQIDENLRSGLSPVEARRQALLKFGAVEAVSEEYRDQKGLPFVETLLQDTRYALRRLRTAPAFTITTVLTLALGIGATTSIFTLVHAVLLKSLPVANPAELYRLGKETRCCYVGGYSQDKEFSLVSYELYKYFRDNTKEFSELAAFPAFTELFGVQRAGRSEAAQSYPGEFVSGNYFTTFGIGAYAGRALTPQDDRPNAAPVAVMSYRLWRERYGSDPSVIGSVFNINDKPITVVGITPPGFFGDSLRSTPPDFFMPLNVEPFVESDADLNKYDTHWLELIGRVKPGAIPGAVEAAMRVELKQWLRSHWGEMSPNDHARFPEQTLYLSPGGAGITSMREQYEHWLQILMMVSGFVLLIVCANVANLMLVRGLERRRETSLSIALGARSSRVVRQALTESILLALLGGAAGLAIAFAGTRLILHLAFPSMPGFIAFHPGAAVRLGYFATDWPRVWHRSGVDDNASGSDRGAAWSRPKHGSGGFAPQEGTGGVAGCAFAGFAVGVRTPHRRFAEIGASGFRIRTEPAHRGEHRSTARRLSNRATVAILPAHPRFHCEHSRRIFRGSLPVFTASRRLGGWRLGGWTSPCWAQG
jgi:MacB-like periplasmic core domain